MKRCVDEPKLSVAPVRIFRGLLLFLRFRVDVDQTSVAPEDDLYTPQSQRTLQSKRKGETVGQKKFSSGRFLHPRRITKRHIGPEQANKQANKQPCTIDNNVDNELGGCRSSLLVDKAIYCRPHSVRGVMVSVYLWWWCPYRHDDQ